MHVLLLRRHGGATEGSVSKAGTSAHRSVCLRRLGQRRPVVVGLDRRGSARSNRHPYLWSPGIASIYEHGGPHAKGTQHRRILRGWLSQESVGTVQ